MNQIKQGQNNFMPCPCCQAFVHISIRTPADLNKAINHLQHAIRHKALQSIGHVGYASPFSELGHNSWGDLVNNYFTCLHCGQHFELTAETYHGSGGQLKAIETRPANIISEG